MSRILLTWELGLNLGHLTRLLPVAQRLKDAGHVVLLATRDIQGAARIFGPAGIPFVQAPHLPKGFPLAHRAAGYADILLSQGWSDSGVLCGLTHAWLNLFGLFKPDRLVLDYSPAVSLAARIAGIPTTLIGNGFELPPIESPLPCFPGFSWATTARAAQSEAIAIENCNAVLSGFKARTITAVRDLVAGQRRYLATFPELDHYGSRPDENYIGPLLGWQSGVNLDWPDAEGPRIFACLRSDTSHVEVILGTLARMTARVVCVVSGFSGAQLAPFNRAHIRFSSIPVDLHRLSDADLCITYGAEGTMLTFLLAGVPQLISPWHVETYMAGGRIEENGFGAMLPDKATEVTAMQMINKLATNCFEREKVEVFARSSARFMKDRGVASCCG
jgi:UDP:flavonoid glycosyltransferase YjiC (YdhE family)